jgi:NAD(P)H-dependent FMN reductase
MIQIAVIIGSTRPKRRGEAVGKWVFEAAQKRSDAQFELVDLLDYNLPLLDEPVPASQGVYEKEHTKKWSAKISAFDAFVFVTPEYNHGMNGALKNALDFLYKEWNNKACGFVSYGGDGGVRAVEMLRLVMGTLSIADVSKSVSLSLRNDFDGNNFKPQLFQEKSLNGMLDQVIAWGSALQKIR